MPEVDLADRMALRLNDARVRHNPPELLPHFSVTFPGFPVPSRFCFARSSSAALALLMAGTLEQPGRIALVSSTEDRLRLCSNAERRAWQAQPGRHHRSGRLARHRRSRVIASEHHDETCLTGALSWLKCSVSAQGPTSRSRASRSDRREGLENAIEPRRHRGGEGVRRAARL